VREERTSKEQRRDGGIKKKKHNVPIIVTGMKKGRVQNSITEAKRRVKTG